MIEVVRAVSIAALPGSARFVEGLIDVRGSLTPVLDVRARFGLPPRRLKESDYLILVRTAGHAAALRVDDVEDFVSIDSESIDSVAYEKAQSAQVLGLVRLPDGLLVVWDLDAFLSEDDAAVLSAALAGIREDRGDVAP